MSLHPKLLSPKQYSLFNDSINIRTARNSSFEINLNRRRSSNGRFKNTGSVLRGSKVNDFYGNLMTLYQQGQVAFKENNFSEAIKHYQDCLLVDPMHMPSRYMLGVCYFSMASYEKCQRELSIVKDQQPKYNKNLFIIFALACKKQSQIEKSILVLDEAITNFPECSDLWLFKGKMELKLRRYADAEVSFRQAVQFNPKKPQGYTFLADCQRLQSNFLFAIKNYHQALKLEDGKSKNTLLKLTICYYEMAQYSQAMQTIDQYLLRDDSSSEAYKLKGQILQKLGRKNESQLYFEQALQSNNSKFAVSKSLVEIAKFKIEEKDFYQLQHTLMRREYLDLDQQVLRPYVLFCDGVVALMKKQFNEGLNCLEQLRKIELPGIIAEQYLDYLGYAYMMMHQFQKALETFQQNDSCIYNQFICNGIIQFDQYELAIQYFTSATSINNIDPLMYKSILMLRKGVQNNDQDLLQETITTLERVNNQGNSQLYYLKSLAYASIGDYNEALIKCTAAIEKADENLASHYYLKGMLLVELGEEVEAIQEFGICLGIDDQYCRAFRMRAMCYAHMGEVQSAFEEINSYLASSEDYLFCGHILFNQGLYSEALQTYRQEPNPTKEHKECICQCLLMLRQFEDLYILLEPGNDIQGLKIFEMIVEFKYTQAFEALTLLLKNKKPSLLFQRYDLLFWRGVVLIYMQRFQEAIMDFEKCLTITKNVMQGLQANYNVMICWMFMRKFKYAHTQMDNSLKQSDNKHLYMTLKILLQDSVVFELSNVASGTLIILQDSIKLQPFCDSAQRYSLYPYFNIPQQKVKLVQPKYENSLILELNELSIDIRPSAPWIRRNQEGVIFTDNLQKHADVESSDCSAVAQRRT